MYHFLQLVLLGALFGSSAMMFKFLAGELSIYFTVFLRLLVGGLTLMIFCIYTKTPIIMLKNLHKLAFVTIVNFVIPLVLFCNAGKILDSSIVSILNGMFPVFTIIFAHFILNDKISFTGSIGIVLSMLGVCVLNLKNGLHFELNQVLAAIMIIIATICYAISTIFTRVQCKDIPPLTNATAGIVLGAILLSPSTFFENNMTALLNFKIVLAIRYFGIFSTAIAYAILFHLIKVRGATFAANCSFLTPIFGTIYGMIFMHEQMTQSRVVGGLLILTGLALILKLYPKFSK